MTVSTDSSPFSPQSFDELVNGNPQFASSDPSLAYDSFTTADAQLAVPAAATASATTAANDAINSSATANDGTSLWGWIGSHLKAGATTALDWANKGLTEVQQDYKFIHSVYTRHGFVAGFLTTAGVAAGAAVGSLAGPEGAFLGGDLAASFERRVLGNNGFQDSYVDSMNPNYQVSFGRDVANALSKVPGAGALADTNSGYGQIVSGVTDAVADFTLDPVRIGSSVPAALKGGKYLELAKPESTAVKGGLTGVNPVSRYPAILSFLVSHNMRALTPEGIDVLRWGTDVPHFGTPPLNNGYNKALDDIAASDSGTIIRNYPPLRGLAPELGKLDSADAVHQVLRTSYTATERESRIYGPAVLPSKTLLRPLADKLRTGAWNTKTTTTDVAGNIIPLPDRSLALDQRGMLANQRNFLLPRRTTPMIRDADTGQLVQAGDRQTLWGAAYAGLAPGVNWADAIGGAVAKKVRTFSGYTAYSIGKNLEELSGKTFDFLNPEALEGMRRNLYYGLGDQESKRVVGQLADLQAQGHAGSVAAMRTLWNQATVDVIKAAGLPADNDMMAKVMQKTGQLSDDPISREYAVDHLGNSRSAIRTESGTKLAAVDTDQASTTGAFIDFRAMKAQMHDLGVLSSVFGKADDFYSSKIIQKLFKPLALLTLGFGLRIAAAESIPAMMRYGSAEMAKQRVNAVAANMGYKMLGGEDGHAAAAAAMAMPGMSAHEALLAQQDPSHVRSVLDSAGVNGPAAKAKAAVPFSRAVIRSKVGPGMIKWANAWDPEGFDNVVRAVLTNDGHIPTEITRTGHMVDDDSAGRAAQAVDLVGQKLGAAHAAANGDIETTKYALGDKYGRWSPGNEHFNLQWALELQKVSQSLPHQQMARNFLDEVAANGGDTNAAWSVVRNKEAAAIKGVAYDPTKPDYYGPALDKKDDLRAVERPILDRYHVGGGTDGTDPQDPLEFADDRMSRLRGNVTGQDGEVHTDLLNQIANGEKPKLPQLEGLPVSRQPYGVVGREIVAMPGDNQLSRVIQYGFKRVVDPVVNGLSRQPLYGAALKREMRSLDYAVQKGALTKDDAFGIAQVRATHAILPQIHNTALRTQFATMANSFLPFYFAQEQAVKRTLHLIHEDPSAIRKYQLIYEGLNNTSFTNTDASGNKFVMLPGTGAVGNAILHLAPLMGLDIVGGLPMAGQGSLNSLKTVVPEFQMPGVSPIVSFAAQQLAKWEPNLTRQIAPLVGQQAMTADVWDWMLPNAPLRNAVRAVRADESDRAFSNAMMSSWASAYYHGQLPPANASTPEIQAALDRIKNNARSTFMVKAILGMVSPLSPQVSQEDFTAAGDSFSTEFQKMIKSNNGDYLKALQQFTTEHGSKAVSYTVAKSSSDVHGAYAPYTNKAIDWIQGNSGLIQSELQKGAAFLIPQVGDVPGDQANAQAIHDELIQMHLRSRDTPQDFANAVYVAGGNNQWAPVVTKHYALMKSFADAGDTASADQERSRYNAMLQSYGATNPLWYDDYQDSSKTHLAQEVLKQFSTIFSNPAAMGPNFETPQVQATRNLYGQYVQHVHTLMDMKQQGISGSTQVKSDWASYLSTLEQTQPELAPVIRSVFIRLANASNV